MTDQHLNGNGQALPELRESLTEDRLAFAARVLKLIANPSKLAILQRLHLLGETSVGQLCEELGLSQPLLSHHLASLKNGGIVACERRGKQMIYSLKLTELTSVLACIERCPIKE